MIVQCLFQVYFRKMSITNRFMKNRRIKVEVFAVIAIWWTQRREIQKCSNVSICLLFCLYLLLMASQARFSTMNRIINQNKGKLNLHQLQNKFGSRLTSKMIRKYEFTNNKFLKKYSLIQRRYEKGLNRPTHNQWLENQRKLFIWFSIIFCNHLHRNYEELTTNDWQTLSHLFFDKSIILLQYETKQIQRNPQRVHWAKREQLILLDAVRNGKLSHWNEISKRIFFETGGKYYKTSKQCRQHWFNHLDNSKKKGDWLKSEDLLLLKTVKNEGRKWSTITHLLGERRTEHMVKNRFNSLISGVIRNDEAEHQEESILENLITKLQVQIAQFPEENNRESQEIGAANNLNIQLSEEEIQRENQHEIIQEQLVSRQQPIRPNSSQQMNELRLQSDPNMSIPTSGWGGIINSQAVQSPYFFVFSPFSFSSTPSTVSPFLSNYQTWTNWTNPAHQTLFFNPQCGLKGQMATSPHLEVKKQEE